jgi:hypothetical protein
MADDRSILRAQQVVLRLATDPLQGGVPLKVLAADCGVPEASLRSYGRADAPAMMPLSVLHKLAPVIGAELASLLMPDHFVLVAQPGGSDHAQFARAAGQFSAAYVEARDPASEAGEAIGAGEDAALARLKLAAVAVGDAKLGVG